jgi:hypothetical protein
LVKQHFDFVHDLARHLWLPQERGMSGIENCVSEDLVFPAIEVGLNALCGEYPIFATSNDAQTNIALQRQVQIRNRIGLGDRSNLSNT